MKRNKEYDAIRVAAAVRFAIMFGPWIVAGLIVLYSLLK